MFDVRTSEQSKSSNFLNGQVHMLLKENDLQPSNAMRHASDLCKVVGRISQPFFCKVRSSCDMRLIYFSLNFIFLLC